MKEKLTINNVGEVIKNKYDDRPMYEINKTASVQEDLGYSSDRPTYKYFDGVKKSAPSPSPILSWERESRKRSLGQDNEIDRAEILAAMSGIKNKWTERYKKNPKLFEGLTQKNGKFDWEAVKML